MPAENVQGQTKKRRRVFHYRGRFAQMFIYLGKFLRMFVYQNDWKVLPMAAVIAGLVAMVIRKMYFRTMEGTLMGAFALSCVAIWNGCFNSIQVVCRERDVLKREHRSGMHISSYVMAHLLYQGLLCLMQTAVTMYVCKIVGIQFPEEGLFTPKMIIDIGITMFLISFASDVLSLWISSLARNTTTAMTIMPFILIFQLVFSGAMLSLPEWAKPLSSMTISNYGLTALASQADYNNRPLVSLWSSLIKLKNTELNATVTVGQIMDYMEDENNPGVKDLRAASFSRKMTVRELADLLEDSGNTDEVLTAVETKMFLDTWGDEELDIRFNVGEIADKVAENPEMQEERDKEITVRTTVGEIIDTIGENKVHWEIQQKATAANYNEDYVNSKINIAICWGVLIFFTMIYALLATITLEFIDKDKR